MKKLFFIVIVLLSMFIVFGCSPTFGTIKDSISEIRYNIFAGENLNYSANFMSGQREEPYEFNGYTGVLMDFGVLSVWFNKSFDILQINIATIKFDNNEIIVELEKSPFEDVYMVDIERIISNDSIIIININNTHNGDLTLNCISKDWEIDYNKALKIGSETMSEILDKKYKNGKIEGECYLKIMYDKQMVLKTYFWFFSFLDNTGKQYGCVIDPITGEILAIV